MSSSGIDDFAAADERHAVGGDARGGTARAARRGARREPGADADADGTGRRGGPDDDARLPRLAADRGRARGDRAGHRARGGRALLAARRARLERARRRAGRRGAGPRRRRHLRDVPALPRAHRRGRRAARGRREVRAAPASRRGASTRSGRRSRRASCRWSRRTTPPPRPSSSAPRTRSASGAASRAPRRCWRSRSTRARVAGCRSSCSRARLATFPARRFALAGKGAIELGNDADVALVRPHAPWTLTADDLRQRHPLSPFLGRELRHRVVRTLLRGRTVQVDGSLVGAPRGRLVRASARA